MLKLTSYEQYSENRATLFSRLDVNGDRVLNVNEFHQGLGNIGIDFTEEEVDYIFSVYYKLYIIQCKLHVEVLDPQGIGTLTYRKFL